MALGYNNKVLMVDLTTGSIGVEEPGEKFYRQFLGGTGLGTYYCMRDIPKGADPLGPDNVLVLSTGVLTGAPVMAASRMSANAKSPLSGGIGDSQAGGYWAPAFKYAGFDAVVVKGKAEKPVYIFVADGKAEIRDASHIWGMKNKDYEAALRKEINSDVVVAGIGPSGEKLNLYACIINERSHACGRTGMGAVMGSKNLKCVAAIGKRPPYEYADPGKLKEFAKQAGEWAKTSPQYARLVNYGTNGGITNNNSNGGLPTRNHSEGYFEPTETKLTSMVMNETISIGSERCYMCHIACKRHVKCTAEKDGWDVDPDYGGPEYETVASFGSFLMIDDMPTVAKANEICNAYGLDTISAGAAVAFAMECYENGIITPEMAEGHDLVFGNRQAAIWLLEKIANREGFLGELLAQGTDNAAKALGNGAQKYLATAKGLPLAAHMTRDRTKRAIGLHYAINPIGGDHVGHGANQLNKNNFDGIKARGMYQIGFYEPMELGVLDLRAAKLVYYSQCRAAIDDSLCYCARCFGSRDSMYPIESQVNIVNAITDWETNYFELMKSGERVKALMRMFNYREGLTKEDDSLPEKVFQPLTVGASAGQYVDRDKLKEVIAFFYDMAGFDANTGAVKRSKIYELDLQWAESLM